MNLILEHSKHLKYYGNMNDIFDVLDGVCEQFDWYISDIETNCSPPQTLSTKELFIEGEELKKVISEHDIQFVWAVFSALQKGSRPAFTNAPFADGNPSFWQGSPKPQMKEALFEIVCWDSSLYLLIGLPDGLGQKFLSKYTDAVDLDSYNETNSY